MKLLAYLLLLLATGKSVAQGFLDMDTLRALPSEVTAATSGTFHKGYCVDFNGDGRRDFIVEVMPGAPSASQHIEYWITSDLTIVKKLTKYGQDYDYFWFVNLDADAEPEIFRATGYEDGID